LPATLTAESGSTRLLLQIANAVSVDSAPTGSA
jgi:hypothetical protein